MGNPQQDIRIGTLVQGKATAGEYVAQIIPHGFESFQLFFWQQIPDDVDLAKVADEIRTAIGDRDIVISSLEICGNPLEETEIDRKSLEAWERLIDNAHLFGAGIVAGFTGRLRGKSIPESMPRFQEVFTPLIERAASKGLRIAFENCPMDGDWKSGDWNLAHNPAAWELMFDAIPAENMGLEWEPCHQMTQLIDPMPQIRTWGHRMFHIHGKCATIKWDVVREHGIGGAEPFVFHRTPGFGDCNWTDIISDLRRGGFQGEIDIEGWHDPVYRGDLEMTGQVHGLNYLKQCRGGAYAPNPVVAGE